MSSVDGLTKTRMLAIEAASVVSGAVNGTTGHLILTTHGGTVIDAGYVWGTVVDADTTHKGIIQISTDAEAAAGTVTTKAVTPANLAPLFSSKQPLDTDLTVFAALTPADDDIVQRKAGAWTNRTVAQFKTDLNLVKADVGLSNVDNTTDATKPVSAAQAAAIAVRLLASSNLADVPTPATARTNLNVPRRQLIDVLDYGVVADGVTDDAAAIQSAINASSPGDIILFPAATCVVGTTIKLLKSRTYKGRGREYSSIKMKSASNLDAVMASETWLSVTSTGSDNPINIYDLKIDGNNTNQTSGSGHGLALITFWNTLENLEVINCRGNGILVTSQRKDGTEISGSAVEVKILRCAVRSVCQTLGVSGAAIYVYDPTSSTQSVTDGWIKDCIVQDTLGHGIIVSSPAGWLVSGNHLYGVRGTGILFDRGGHVRIVHNYIETYGYSTTVNTYCAIMCGGDSSTWIGSASPNIIMGNTAFYTSGAASTSGIRGLRFEVSNGVTTRLLIVGNALYGATHVAGSVGIKLSSQGSGGNLYVQASGNTAYGWDTQHGFAPSTGLVSVSGDILQPGMPTTSTDGFGRLPTCAGAPTGVPADTTKGIPAVYDTTNHKLWVYDTAWKGVVLT